MKKTILINFIFILLFFQNLALGKGLPPGTGSNDVPVNILILLDRSGSMGWAESDGIKRPSSIAVDANNDMYIARSGNSIVKVSYENEKIDPTWSFNPSGFCTMGDVKKIQLHTASNGKEYLYVADYSKNMVFRINVETTFCDRSWSLTNVRSMVIHNDTLYAFGQSMWVLDLSDPTASASAMAICTNPLWYSQDLKIHAPGAASATIDSSGSNLYFHIKNELMRFKILSNKCANPFIQSQINTPGVTYAYDMKFKPGSDSEVYMVDYYHEFYKYTLNPNKTAVTGVKADVFQSSSQTSSTNPNQIIVNYPYGLDIRDDKIFFVSKGSKSGIHIMDLDMQWIKDINSSRMKGAKEAIAGLVNDSSLNSHVDFGFGVWSSSSFSTIFSDWDNRGTSDLDDDIASPCSTSNCLKVLVNRDGSEQILKKLPAIALGGGTYAGSFAKLANEYYLHQTLSPIDSSLDCQNSHIVVIGDGDFSDNINSAKLMLESMANGSKKIKTHMVAYGPGISPGGLSEFEELAEAGGTNDVLVALNPTQLKTQLRTRISQIVADNFAFTAPSIPPNKNEGSTAVYQSQFKHKSKQQWRGSLIRTTIDVNGNLNTSDPANWDASKVLPNPNNRKIWSIIDGKDHTDPANKNNNFTVENFQEIGNNLAALNYDVEDYHSLSKLPIETQRCATEASGVEDGNTDDIKGLINFLRGQDYFDYDADCDLTESRFDEEGNKAYLGDIYHSELLVVGAPSANTAFTDKSQEAYWRYFNGYDNWAEGLENRKEIIYVGANDGMLHAFNAVSGVEEWAFIPPLITGILPTMIDKTLNRVAAGGTNAIYGVDGSPMVHDMFFRSPLEALNTPPSWHTILMIPYGRGGKGFSILDVTNPDNPLHLFSVYNDASTKVVTVIDHNGASDQHPYVGNSYLINELKQANGVTGNFIDGTGQKICDDTANNQCYFSRVWTVQTDPKIPGLTRDDLTVKRNGVKYENYTVEYDAAGDLKVVLADKTRFLAYEDPNLNSDSLVITINADNPSVGVQTEPGYDYSRLGETWSQPRILRIPNNGAGDQNTFDDIYVAVLGGGFGGPNPEIGSNLFVINLQQDPTDELFAKIEKQIQIDDLDNGIVNSTPGLPVVITSDEITSNYTGGLIYLNDIEGKITKFNLTNMSSDQDGNPIVMYDSTTLFTAGTTKDNGRYMYHSMDAGTLKGSNVFWMFAGTGDFTRLTYKDNDVSNLLLGLKDNDFPYYKNVGTVLTAKDLDDCSDTTMDRTGDDCPTSAELGWYVTLDNSRKVTAEPTLTRGRVLFPVFEPSNDNACNTGSAFICNNHAKCGTPKNTEIGSDDDLECLQVGVGVLSKIIVFGKKLFANIAGEASDEASQGARKDLVTINGANVEIESFRNSWRGNY